MASSKVLHLIGLTAVVAAGLLAAGAASAQYKSIGPDGRVTYSDTPPPANARVVDQKSTSSAPTAGPSLPFELQQAASKYPVTLYTGDNCSPCQDARAYLRNRGVPFTEKTVTSSDDIALFKQQSPDGTAPVVLVGSRKAVGFTQSGWASLLDSAGYPAVAMLPRDYQNTAPTPLSPNTRGAGEDVTQPKAPPPRRGASPSADAAPAAPAANPSGFHF